ncbi:Na+/H+ antiporter NhaC family protein [Halosquirtibacter xylanolyticus]|uniref:Na+/H+ antiporter NhaC family protein n=1 Tax=Halosquirtibacter xylanolyticus TaxID=3374599 RepID=UPI0037495CE4|nr:Na+/H+ antiporter NhaC family protein [Prolixibacteraceae bacterium]
MNNTVKSNKWALLPILVFLVIYLVSSLWSGDFYKMPLIISFLVAAFCAIAMNSQRSVPEKIESFVKGMGDKNIMMMVFIFLLAGCFAATAKAVGAVDATVNVGLHFLPPNIMLAGVFVISCFISLSIGTSLGTILALAPMAVSLSERGGVGIALALGAIVGGSMFGDNLSLISDTTIAASRTQGCSMRDKFRMNFKIVVPAALVTIVIYALCNVSSSVQATDFTTQELIMVLPYLFVLISALAGMNVIFVLLLGTVFAGSIGLMTGKLVVWDWLKTMSDGAMGMSEIIIISMIVGGIVELIRINGGIQFLLNTIGKRANGKKGAEFGIAMLVSLVNVFTANNTIAIVMSGPIVKDIATAYNISPKRAASIMDTFSCFVQGLIPYGAQILAAVTLVGLDKVTPIELMQFLYYPYLMGMAAILSILLQWPVEKVKS